MVSIVSVNFERCLNAALQILREPPSSVLSVYHSVDPFGSVQPVLLRHFFHLNYRRIIQIE